MFAERALVERRARTPRVFRIGGEIQGDVVVVCSGDHGFDASLLERRDLYGGGPDVGLCTLEGGGACEVPQLLVGGENDSDFG